MSRTRSFSQEGFTLAALIVILTIMMIVIAYTVPEQWSLVMKRERDRQTIFLMKQYARGILRFRTKHSVLPTSLEQLQEAREPRMLRGTGKYPCPLTGKEEDWILVPQQAVAGPPMPGTNPGGGGPIIGGNPATENPVPPSAGTGTGSRLVPGASPPDYKGEFIGVRPRATGKSFIAFNGVEDYDQWVFTANDLQTEIQTKLAALNSR